MKHAEPTRRNPPEAARPPAARGLVAQARPGGQALDSDVRTDAEVRFGHDFSRVRVHAEDSAAHAQDARAFTIGTDIVFARGAYAPGTALGRRLLAHELAHVVQQTSGAARLGNAGVAGDRFEREADAVADVVAAGGSAVSRMAAYAGRFPGSGGHGLPLQRDLALKPPVRAAAGGPVLTDEQRKAALAYNRKRLAGVDAATITTIEGITGHVLPRREPAQIDDTFVAAIARWQSWFNLPPDGRLAPLTTRTFSDELRAEAKLAELPDASKARLRAAADTLDTQAAGEPMRAAGSAKPSQVGAWDAAGGMSNLRSDLGQDFQGAGKDGKPDKAAQTSKWLARAQALRATPDLDEDTRIDGLHEIAKRLSSEERMAEAMEVVSLVGISTAASRETTVKALQSLGANASGSAQQAKEFLKALIRLAGEPAPDQPADPQAWLEKHTAAVGKAIAALERVLGAAAGLTLTSLVLKSSFSKDTEYKSDPRGAGSVSHLQKDTAAKDRLKADCDVYANYGLRLLRAEGWEPVGYFTFQGNLPSDVAHAVGLARRPSKTQGKFEYLVVNSLSSSFLEELGEMDNLEAAKRETDKKAGGSWGHHFYAPVRGAGEFDPGLNEFHPERFRYRRD